MKLKVLIFDDDEILLEVLSRIVRNRGHEVFSYSEPKLCPLYADAACSCSCESACGDIIITDNNMPRMTGLELIQQQRRRGCKGIMRNKAVMSGGWTDEDYTLAGKLGCKVFEKPIMLDQLFSWLEECESHVRSERSQPCIT